MNRSPATFVSPPGSNAVLKGSSDAEQSNIAAVDIIRRVLRNNEINENVVTLLPAAREVVQEMFTATRYIDVIIPRGSDSLIQFVRKNSLVPVIETGAGVCHVYVESHADINKVFRLCFAEMRISVQHTVRFIIRKYLNVVFFKFRFQPVQETTCHLPVNQYCISSIAYGWS